MENIQDHLTKVKAAITRVETQSHRVPGSVTLIAVSKSQPIEKIKIALDNAQRDFGESYLQEAMEKIRALAAYQPIWHYIGRIQSKKAKLIAPHFAWVQSVASYEIAELLNRYRPTNLPPLNICVQVNISQEISKAGVLVAEILPLAQKILQLPNLKLRGLMAIPLPQKEFAHQFATFNLLALELKNLQQHEIPVDTLSMGMSEDYAAAIAAGATMIRVGTAIFGTREN